MSITKLTLPLGSFEVQCPEGILNPFISDFREKAVKFYQLRSGLGQNPNEIHSFTTSLDEMRHAFDKLWEKIRSSETPFIYPRLTKHLIFAGLIANALNLSFRITNVSLSKDKTRWELKAKICDLDGRETEEIGMSRAFNWNESLNEKVFLEGDPGILIYSQEDYEATGALLSACADLFVSAVASILAISDKFLKI